MPDTKPNIYQRIHAVMEVVSYIQKEQKQGMQYPIVSHDAVTALLRPKMVEQGIVYHPTHLEYQQEGNRTQVSLTVRFASVDDPQDYVDVPSLGFGIDSQDKGPGKAVSYAVKYALLKTFGLETGDDPDNDQSVTHQPAARPVPPVFRDEPPHPAESSPFDDAPPASSQETLVQEVKQKVASNGKPYLTVALEGIGWVNVFDQKLFDLFAEGSGVAVETVQKGKFTNLVNAWPL